jgi:hypothetical protein
MAIKKKFEQIFMKEHFGKSKERRVIGKKKM